jgi:hypothetical protein
MNLPALKLPHISGFGLASFFVVFYSKPMMAADKKCLFCGAGTVLASSHNTHLPSHSSTGLKLLPGRQG